MSGELQYASEDGTHRLLKSISGAFLTLSGQCCPGGGGAGGGNCTWSGDVGTINFSKDGGSESVQIHTYAGCGWSSHISSGASWLSASPSSALAGGLLRIQVEYNSSGQRNDVVLVKNTVAADGVPTGTVVYSVNVNQSGDPLPPSCPTGLATTYLVQGGPLTHYNAPDLGCFEMGNNTNNPWNGIISGAPNTCYWAQPGIDFSSWEGKFFEVGQLWLTSSGWMLYMGLMGAMTAFRKAAGSTPIGTYVNMDSCGNPTLTIVSG